MLLTKNNSGDRYLHATILPSEPPPLLVYLLIIDSLCLNPYGLLSGMDVHITGLGPLSGLRAPVCAWARGAGLAHAAPLLATQLQRELHIALAELPLWDLMHGKH